MTVCSPDLNLDLVRIHIMVDMKKVMHIIKKTKDRVQVHPETLGPLNMCIWLVGVCFLFPFKVQGCGISVDSKIRNIFTHLGQDLAVNLASVCALLNEWEVSQRTKCSRH